MPCLPGVESNPAKSTQIYALYFQQSPFTFQNGSDGAYVGEMVSKLGPLPPQWQSLWKEMQRRSMYSQVNGECYTETVFPSHAQANKNMVDSQANVRKMETHLKKGGKLSLNGAEKMTSTKWTSIRNTTSNHSESYLLQYLHC